MNNKLILPKRGEECLLALPCGCSRVNYKRETNNFFPLISIKNESSHIVNKLL